MRTILMPAVLLLLTALPHQVLAQGMLGKIREDVREEEDEEEDCDEENHGKRKKRAGNCGCDDGGRSIIDLGILFRLEGAEYHAFPAYPYPLGLPGYVQYDPTPVHAITGNPGDQLDLKDWSMRLSIENGNNFDRLNRVNGIFAVESRWGLGLRTSWNYLYESLGNGASDDLVLGNVNATFRIAQSEKIMVRWGIGGWIFADDGGSDGGLNLLLSADYFPMRPFVFSGLLEGGSVGNASIFHTRITGGVLYKGLEFFGGYDFMQISDTNLHTPMLGLRVWF